MDENATKEFHKTRDGKPDSVTILDTDDTSDDPAMEADVVPAFRQPAPPGRSPGTPFQRAPSSLS